MTPEQRRQLQRVADMRIDGECTDPLCSRSTSAEDGDHCIAYEMSIDDAFETAAAAVRVVREVLADKGSH